MTPAGATQDEAEQNDRQGHEQLGRADGHAEHPERASDGHGPHEGRGQRQPRKTVPQQVGQGADDHDGDQVVDAEHRMGEAVEEATAAGEVGEGRHGREPSRDPLPSSRCPDRGVLPFPPTEGGIPCADISSSSSASWPDSPSAPVAPSPPRRWPREARRGGRRARHAEALGGASASHARMAIIINGNALVPGPPLNFGIVRSVGVAVGDQPRGRDLLHPPRRGRHPCAQVAQADPVGRPRPSSVRPSTRRSPST